MDFCDSINLLFDKRLRAVVTNPANAHSSERTSEGMDLENFIDDAGFDNITAGALADDGRSRVGINLEPRSFDVPFSGDVFVALRCNFNPRVWSFRSRHFSSTPKL